MHKALDQATEKMETLPTNANVEAHSKAKAQYTRARTQATKNSWHEKTASLNMEKDTTGLWNLTRVLNNDNPSKSKIVIEANNELIAEKRAANSPSSAIDSRAGQIFSPVDATESAIR